MGRNFLVISKSDILFQMGVKSIKWIGSKDLRKRSNLSVYYKYKIQNVIFNLHYKHGLTIEEIAEIFVLKACQVRKILIDEEETLKRERLYR